MEFLPESLKQRIRVRKQIGLQESLAIINQIAAALFYAHGKGFIHRDVKPDNIMFRSRRDAGDSRFRHRPRPGSHQQDHPLGHQPGHPALHEPGAAQRQARRRPQRHLQPGRGPLRNDQRRPALQGQPDHVGGPEAHQRTHPQTARGTAALPAADRAHAGQGARQARRQRGGVARADQAAAQALQAAQGRQGKSRRPAVGQRPGKDPSEHQQGRERRRKTPPAPSHARNPKAIAGACFS